MKEKIIVIKQKSIDSKLSHNDKELIKHIKNYNGIHKYEIKHVNYKINKLANEKLTRKQELLKILDKNKKGLYVNIELAHKLNISQRTLNRYINELTIEDFIKSELVNFKEGGRGYFIKRKTNERKKATKNIISKKESIPNKV